jgi:hypothetical protein
VSFFFPNPPRDFPLRRPLKVSLRTLHILVTGVLLGGCIFEHSKPELGSWLIASIVSGLLLLAVDLHASFAILLEVRGLVVLVKTAIMALLPHLWEVRIPLLVVALVIGALSTHMSARLRHYVLFFRHQVVPDERRG